MGIVFALGISLLAGALSAKAETSTNQGSVASSIIATQRLSGSDVNCLLDSDGDGVANPSDSDVDGDGNVNGEDADIDGDGVLNQKDGDPVATNCNDDAAPPIVGIAATLGEPIYDWRPVVTFALLGASLLGVAIALIFKRPKSQR